jgi:putative oxidoreductase
MIHGSCAPEAPFKAGLRWHVLVCHERHLNNRNSLMKIPHPPSDKASTSFMPVLAAWAPLPIRLAVGYGFMAHGYAKFSRGPETFAVVLHTLGVPGPELAAWAATLTELIGGAAVFLGVLIPWVSIPMAVVLLTALVTVHLPYGFFSVKFAEVTESGIKFGSVGYEILLLYFAGLAALVLGGPGKLSLGGWIARRRYRDRVRKTLESLAARP